MDILITILLCITVILSFAIFYFLFKSKAKDSNPANIDQLKLTLKEIEIKLSNINLEYKLDNNKNFSQNFVQISDSLSKIQFALTESLNNNSTNQINKLNELRIELINLFNNNFKELNSNVDGNLKKINEKVEQRLAEGLEKTNKTFSDILISLTKIDEASKNIQKLSSEVVSLQDILDNNQKRGAFGEFSLNRILNTVFGDNQELYKLQYCLKNDDSSFRADAVVILPEPYKLLCIDAKFPYPSYQNYNEAKSEEEEQIALRDFKMAMRRHINDIKSKYIISGITADQALMFVPSDGVLAFIHSKLPTILEEASNARVYITSPSTLLPVLSSIHSLKISQERALNAEKIRISLEKLGKNFKLFSAEWLKLSSSLNQVVNRTLSIDKRIDRINTQFNSISNVEDLDEQELISIEQDS